MSDNQVTEPIETACFCKHGNLGQHESDCPKCPLHFTRGELNALQRERDQLRADMAKVREENATLTAELEQAREDKEGLDWLETVHWGISTWRNDDGEKVWMAWDNDKDTEHTVRSAPTLRAAITLARLAAKTEK